MGIAGCCRHPSGTSREELYAADGSVLPGCQVFAVVGWSREASEPQYRDSIKSETWEVVVPELVFEPEVRERRETIAPAPGTANHVR